jgi:hypothetical protein
MQQGYGLLPFFYLLLFSFQLFGEIFWSTISAYGTVDVDGQHCSFGALTASRSRGDETSSNGWTDEWLTR